MTKPKAVIWGASGHAKVVADIVRLSNQFDIFGFIDNLSPERNGQNFCGSTIIGGYEVLDTLIKQNITNIFFGFGNNSARDTLFNETLKMGFHHPNAIHPQSIIASDTILGQGITICAGAIINSDSEIGNNVIINTGATVDHDCLIGDSSHICPGVHLAGNVTIGKCSWVGIGTIIKEKITIGDDVFIGAGSLVLKDIPSKMLSYGSPSKIRSWKK